MKSVLTEMWSLILTVLVMTCNGPCVRALTLSRPPVLTPIAKFGHRLTAVAALKARESASSLYFRAADGDASGSSGEGRNLVVEADDDESDEGASSEDPTKSLTIMRRLSRGIVPLAASIGFIATPSPSLVIKAAGGAAGGLAGYVVKRTLVEEVDGESSIQARDVTMPPRVAAALRVVARQPSIFNLDLKRLETIAMKNGVKEKDLGFYFSHVFTEAVFAAVQGDDLDLTDLYGVINYAQAVGFTASEIADGLTLAGIKIGEQLEKDERGFYTETYPEHVFFQATKLFFLADKLMGSLDGFYGKRFQMSVVYFTTEQFQEAISAACVTLFERCVQSVLINPQSFTAEDVTTLKSFLTTSFFTSSLQPADMERIAMQAIQSALDQCVQRSVLPGTTSNVSSSDVMSTQLVDTARLRKAQEVLGLNLRDLEATIEARTMPLFNQLAKDLLDGVTDQPDKAEQLSRVLVERMAALQIDQAKGRAVFMGLVSKMNTDHMNQLDRVYNTSMQSVEAVYKIMVSFAHIHEAVATLVKPLIGEQALSLPGLPFAESIRAQLFEIELAHQQASRAEGQHLHREIDSRAFALSPEAQALVRTNVALPKVTSWVEQCIRENSLGHPAREAYAKILRGLNVSSDVWAASAIDFYYQEVAKVAAARAVPTVEDVSRLEQLRDFLQCQDGASVQHVHQELFGEKYIKAFGEAIAATGAVEADYEAALDRLRLRLGLDQKSCNELRSVAVRQRILPVMRDVVDLWRSETDANYRRDKDPKGKTEAEEAMVGYLAGGGKKKESGTSNAFMREILNLVEFVRGSMQGQLDTLNAVGSADAQAMASVFKHFLLLRLTEPNEELRTRFEEAEPTLAQLLGLDAAAQAQMKEALAFSAFRAMVRQLLAQKSTIEPQDIGQFAVLKDKLQLSAKTSEEVYGKACRGALLAHVSEVTRSQKHSTAGMNPGMARRLREQVQSLGLGMRQDSGLSDAVLSLLFSLEVRHLVDNHLMDELPDVQEAYEIPAQVAVEIVESVCSRYLDQALNLALRAARHFEEDDCVKWTKEVVRYSVYAPCPVLADGNLFSEEDKRRLISFYLADLEAAIDAGERTEFTRDEAGNKMRDLISLSTSYVGPKQGIEGLLGRLPDLEERARNADSSTWAWG